jgi:hypothetical protein
MLLSTGGTPSSAKITRSIRLDAASNAVLARTYAGASATSNARRKATFSMWVKRANTVNFHGLAGFNYSGAGASQNIFFAAIQAGGRIEIAQQTSNSFDFDLISTRIFRDPTAWYHIVFQIDTTQATSSNRIKLWVNGDQITAFDTASYPSLNFDTHLGLASNNRIGSMDGGGAVYLPLDGYVADFIYLDGQTQVATDFGKIDASTGAWVPKTYNGVYGQHGFRLDFSDSSAATSAAIGADRSGNANNWTPSNVSVALGFGNDSSLDSPSTYSDGSTGRGNYCTLNALSVASGITISNGALSASKTSSSSTPSVYGSQSVSSGKWYWESAYDAFSGITYVGVTKIPNSTLHTDGRFTDNANEGYAYRSDGQKETGGTAASYGTSYVASTDIIGVALDMDNGRVFFSKNGVWQNSGDPAAGTNAAYTGLVGDFSPAWSIGVASNSFTLNVNFGQQAHDSVNVFKYAPPIGFRALCTANLPTPVIGVSPTAFGAVAYTGTGSSNSISSLSFQPGLVWIKQRSGASDSHALYDSVRGTTKRLATDLTDAEATVAQGVTAFNSNGFTVGTDGSVNESGVSFIAWCWRESPSNGFDIVSYTGTGASQSVAHSLGAVPSLIVVKARNAATNSGWFVYHDDIPSPQSNALFLNTSAGTASSTAWNSTQPDASNFTAGSDISENTIPYVAYLWSEIAGFSKIGSYIGNGSSDGPFVFCGFRPRFVMVKDSSSGLWRIYDAARNPGNNSFLSLYTSTAGSEASENFVDFTSNGFKLRVGAGNGVNDSRRFFFVAFAEMPAKFSRAR